MRIKKILIFHRIKLLRISRYAVLTGVFSSKMSWKEFAETKKSQRFQYQQSYMSYNSYNELQDIAIYNMHKLF